MTDQWNLTAEVISDVGPKSHLNKKEGLHIKMADIFNWEGGIQFKLFETGQFYWKLKNSLNQQNESISPC